MLVSSHVEFGLVAFVDCSSPLGLPTLHFCLRSLYVRGSMPEGFHPKIWEEQINRCSDEKAATVDTAIRCSPKGGIVKESSAGQPEPWGIASTLSEPRTAPRELSTSENV